MSDETATERLRELLDERGEFYKISGNRTWWGRPIDAQTGKPINVFHNQAQPMGEDRLLVELQLATPEQAIAATLGRETCHDEDKGGYFVCSECGAHVQLHDIGRSYVDKSGKRWYATSHEHGLNYCPNCGRRIEVEE